MSNLFKRYPNPVFLETGSYLGGGIGKALEAGFPRIISIELSVKHYKYCRLNFGRKPQVELIHGDSAFALREVIEKIDDPITFWLDGHFSGGDTALGSHRVPLMQELEAIKDHRRNDHTILMPDANATPLPNRWHVPPRQNNDLCIGPRRDTI